MTVLERIRNADKSELSSFLCELVDNCGRCPASKTCSKTNRGFLDFLEQEARDDLEISYVVGR